MKLLILLSSFLLSAIQVAAQLNMTLKSQLNYQQLHNTLLNDIWGYVDTEGNEYALVGARQGVSIVSLADPENPVEVHWHEGQNSVWRDLKTFGHYAYVTTEAEAGLLIIDLSPLPNDPIVTEVYYSGPQNDQWQSAHNLYIDEFGFCYVFGANRDNGGVIILDVATDPLNPIEVGTFDNWYVHDGYARNNILYLAHIYEGTISMVDVTSKSNPILLGTANTPNNFAHNIWPSDDGNFVFTTDEVSGAFLAAYDVSDPTNISEVGRIQSSPGLGIVPHNAHVYQNWLVTSYYTDGITIHDISRPFNMIEVGNYDTSPLQSTNTEGCWGAYPFLPSGIILGTDMEEGLFVFEADYKLGSYLEGNAVDASNNNPLQGVSVNIISNNQTVQSNLSGEYATGIAASGQFQVEYIKPLYFPQTHTIALEEGVVTNFDVSLEPIPSFPLTVLVLEEGTNQPIFDAFVRFEVPLHEVNLNTNGVGEAELTLYYQEEYFITVGKWGYFSSCAKIEINEQTGELTFHLKKGWYDDFSFDFGWTTTSTAESGHWVREIPIATTSGSAPGVDAPADCGNFAFITGNGSLNSNFDQVTNGEVTLISPVFDLTDFTDPHLNYFTWYYNFHGPSPPPDDTLNIFLSNGNQTVRIDYKIGPNAVLSEWVFSSIRVLNYLEPTANMQLFIQISDYPETVNITEAGFDYFSVSNSNTVNAQQETMPELVLFPNPTNGIFQWTSADKVVDIQIYDVQGRKIDFIVSENQVDISNAQSGVYFVEIIFENGRRIVQRIGVE
jgi:choice-of-anchor B domain-containing protein